MSRHEVLWMLALGWAPVGIATAGPQLPCTQPAGNCQLADQLGHGSGNAIGAASDANPASGFSARDNFVIDAGGTITTVCWTGLYVDFVTPADCGPGAVPDLFTITYYTNIEGLPPEPGAIAAGPFDVTATLVKAASGNVVPVAFGDLAEFEFSATHPDVVVSAGECLWIEIQNDTTGSDPVCVWLWSTAPNAAEGGIGDGLSWQNSTQNDFDLAFCLDLPLGDPTGCELQINPGCEGALNACTQTSPDPGCADLECCTLVCEDLPFCCLNGWDSQCVDAAGVICGQCGETGAGNCFAANLTPFCDDNCGLVECVGCCQIVCAVDAVCCEPYPPAWDGICASLAMQLCSCAPGQAPLNDDCENAIAITLGDTLIDNTCATSSPPNHETCNDGFLNGLGLDVWYSYVADFTGQLLVSTCGQANFDTQLAIYEGCDCLALSDPPLACNNEGAVCPPGTSLLVADVILGNCYLIRLGSASITPFGNGTLTLSSTVPPVCDISPFPPGAILEGEACGDNTNGGCENPLPAFTTVQIDDVVHGTAWAFGGQRDTDWFELVLVEDTVVTLNLDAEFTFLMGFIETNPAGSGDCTDATDSVVPFAAGEACTTGIVTVVLAPGTWWPFVSTLGFDGLPCPEGVTAANDYVLSITGAAPCPWDCGDADGVVGIIDFLALLAAWGQVQTPCDIGLGAPGVGIEEFLDMLGHWGACP